MANIEAGLELRDRQNMNRGNNRNDEGLENFFGEFKWNNESDFNPQKDQDWHTRYGIWANETDLGELGRRVYEEAQDRGLNPEETGMAFGKILEGINSSEHYCINDPEISEVITHFGYMDTSRRKSPLERTGREDLPEKLIQIYDTEGSLWDDKTYVEDPEGEEASIEEMTESLWDSTVDTKTDNQVSYESIGIVFGELVDRLSIGEKVKESDMQAMISEMRNVEEDWSYGKRHQTA
jgi:hypothetical protein